MFGGLILDQCHDFAVRVLDRSHLVFYGSHKFFLVPYHLFGLVHISIDQLNEEKWV